MKQIIFILLIIGIALPSFSQYESYYIPSDTTDFVLNETTPDNTPFSQQKKLSLGLNIGSAFSSYGNGIFTSYASPEVRYRATEKFTISVGTMASFTSYNGGFLNPESSQLDYAGRMAQYYMYASGTYQVNDKFRIRAGGIYEVTPNTQYNSFKSGHIGFDLQLTENTFINADFQFSNGYYSPAMYFSNGGIFGNPGRFSNYTNPHQPYFGW
jgi:hypothetical protein